jgi:transcription initiation factor IIF auxiliary subunit
VRIGLHETFGVEYRDLKGKPFEITYHGWGTFDIPFTIYFKKGTGIRKS